MSNRSGRLISDLSARSVLRLTGHAFLINIDKFQFLYNQSTFMPKIPENPPKGTPEA
jgi:hypothetical protein